MLPPGQALPRKKRLPSVFLVQRSPVPARPGPSLPVSVFLGSLLGRRSLGGNGSWAADSVIGENQDIALFGQPEQITDQILLFSMAWATSSSVAFSCSGTGASSLSMASTPLPGLLAAQVAMDIRESDKTVPSSMALGRAGPV